MAILLKIRWQIKDGEEENFRQNQERLCAVMQDHPGVICYHVDYPEASVSEWTEIYATDECFKAHLANPAGQAPLAALIKACDTISCRCWGNPNAESKEMLAGFGTTYHETAPDAFLLHPRADPNSRI